MALVNLLRFSPRSGGIVADEEYWNIFFRRRLHMDNLHRLLTDEMSDDWGIEAVFGTVGYPSVLHEALRDARAELARRHADGRKPDGVREVARVVFEALQEAVRRRIDQKLGFWFGFESSDLVRGYYEREGAKVPIQNAKVKDQCLSLHKGGKRDTLLKAVYDVRATVFGFDPQYGIVAYYLSPENSICGYVHEGFDCIGSGKYAAGLSLGQDFGAKTLKMRKAGYGRVEGVYELLQASLLGMEHFKEGGGRLHFVLLDADGETAAARYREIFDEPAKLCTEAVQAAMAGFLTRAQAEEILEKVLWKHAALDDAEKALFAASPNAEALRYFLRGYKKNEALECAARARGERKVAGESKPARTKGKKGA